MDSKEDGHGWPAWRCSGKGSALARRVARGGGGRSGLPWPTRYRKLHDEAWSYLLDELRPDVALVQEALVTKLEAARRDHAVTICGLEPSVLAGTAVLVRGLESGAGPALDISPHTYAVPVEVQTAAGPLVVVSVHVYPGEKQHADLARLVAELARALPGRPALVGGDFNSARHFDTVYGGKKHATFFDSMGTAGFHQAHWALHGREVQSFWGKQAKEKYQDDHFFLSQRWAPRVRTCEVVDNDLVRRVSDHGPVVLELDVPSA